jgi:hypothetical protein
MLAICCKLAADKSVASPASLQQIASKSPTNRQQVASKSTANPFDVV